MSRALTQARVDDGALLWAVTAPIVVLCVVVHGITVTPITKRLDRRRDGASATKELT